MPEPRDDRSLPDDGSRGASRVAGAGLREGLLLLRRVGLPLDVTRFLTAAFLFVAAFLLPPAFFLDELFFFAMVIGPPPIGYSSPARLRF
jgi:hypothetical protein